jgi:hypothetical protein
MLRWITLAKSWNVPTRTAIATIAVAGGLGMKMIGFDFFEKSEPPSSQDLARLCLRPTRHVAVVAPAAGYMTRSGGTSLSWDR